MNQLLTPRTLFAFTGLSLCLLSGLTLAQGRGGHKPLGGGAAQQNANQPGPPNAIPNNAQNAQAALPNAAMQNNSAMRNGRASQSAEMATMLMQNFDSDDSGTLDLTELQAALEALQQMMQRSQRMQRQAMQAAMAGQAAMQAPPNQSDAGPEARGMRGPSGGHARGGGRGR